MGMKNKWNYIFLLFHWTFHCRSCYLLERNHFDGKQPYKIYLEYERMIGAQYRGHGSVPLRFVGGGGGGGGGGGRRYKNRNTTTQQQH